MKVFYNGRRRAFRTVTLDRVCNEVVLIDQKILPHRFQFLRARTYTQTAAAITDMTVRGA